MFEELSRLHLGKNPKILVEPSQIWIWGSSSIFRLPLQHQQKAMVKVRRRPSAATVAEQWKNRFHSWGLHQFVECAWANHNSNISFFRRRRVDLVITSPISLLWIDFLTSSTLQQGPQDPPAHRIMLVVSENSDICSWLPWMTKSCWAYSRHLYIDLTISNWNAKRAKPVEEEEVEVKVEVEEELEVEVEVSSPCVFLRSFALARWLWWVHGQCEDVRGGQGMLTVSQKWRWKAGHTPCGFGVEIRWNPSKKGCFPSTVVLNSPIIAHKSLNHKLQNNKRPPFWRDPSPQRCRATWKTSRWHCGRWRNPMAGRRSPMAPWGQTYSNCRCRANAIWEGRLWWNGLISIDHITS